MASPVGHTFRLAAVASHPVQYQAPLFQRLAAHPEVDLTVYYGHVGSMSGALDQGFGVPVSWDRPLLEGYRSVALSNRAVSHTDSQRLSTSLRMISELSKNHFDAVLVDGYTTPLCMATILAAWLSGTPILLRTEFELFRPRGRWLVAAKRLLLGQVFARTAAFLSIGTANREFYLSHGVDCRKIFETPYCVDNDFFNEQRRSLLAQRRQLRSALGFEGGMPLIVYSGKLIPRKRPLDLAAAYASIISEGVEAGLLVIGDGPLRGELEAFFEQRMLGNVRILGFKNQTELARYYVCGDVFALPSSFETWGLVVNEAMLFGLPPIVTNMMGATRDLVEHGVDGFVHRVGDIGSLSCYLADLTQNQDKRHRMGKAARRKVAGWNYDACVSGIIGALQRWSK